MKFSFVNVKRVAATLAALLFVLPLVASCAGKPTESATGPQDTITDPDTGTETEAPVSYDYAFRADLSRYLPYLNPEGGKLVLANKQTPVGKDFDPGSVVTLDKSFCLYGKEIQMEETAAEALYAMLTEMRAEGITDTYATSGYRSYARQEYLFNYYLQKESDAHPDWSSEQVKEYVLSYSAYPGTSEHQTGLCVDLMTTSMGELFNYASEYGDGTKPGFAETSAYPWLRENAYKFGFILRYPEDKVDVTGYSYESWHYRFVGQAAARAIHDGNLTLEEYLAGAKN